MPQGIRGEGIARRTQSFWVLKEAFVFSFSLLPILSFHPPLSTLPPLPSFSQTKVGAASELLEQIIACSPRCQALELNSLMLSHLTVKLDFLLSIPHLERGWCLSPSKAS